MALNGTVLVYGSLAYLVAAEGQAGGMIDDYGTAIWWAIGTLSTVGYGDVVPVTTVGRVAAGVLMVLGIGGFGLLILRLSRWYFQQDADATGKELHKIRTELQELRREVSDLANGGGSNDDGA